MTKGGVGIRSALVRFVLVGLLSVGVDTGSLIVLHEVVGLPLAAATTVAFALTLVVNFSLNMGFVFGVRGRLAGRVARFVVLVIVNYWLTLLLVVGIAAAGAHYAVAKLFAAACCAGFNFVAYRHWVFTGRSVRLNPPLVR